MSYDATVCASVGSTVVSKFEVIGKAAFRLFFMIVWFSLGFSIFAAVLLLWVVTSLIQSEQTVSLLTIFVLADFFLLSDSVDICNIRCHSLNLLLDDWWDGWNKRFSNYLGKARELIAEMSICSCRIISLALMTLTPAFRLYFFILSRNSAVFWGVFELCRWSSRYLLISDVRLRFQCSSM